MAQLKARAVRNALRSLGFVEKTKSDHYRYTLWVNGKKARVGTMISFDDDDLGPPLVSRMAKQLHVTKAEFLDLVDGKVEREAYYEMLRQKLLLER